MSTYADYLKWKASRKYKPKTFRNKQEWMDSEYLNYDDHNVSSKKPKTRFKRKSRWRTTKRAWSGFWS